MTINTHVKVELIFLTGTHFTFGFFERRSGLKNIDQPLILLRKKTCLFPAPYPPVPLPSPPLVTVHLCGYCSMLTYQGWYLHFHCPDCSSLYRYIPHHFGLLKYSACSHHTHFVEEYMESKLLKVEGILQTCSQVTHLFLFQRNTYFVVLSPEKLELKKKAKKKCFTEGMIFLYLITHFIR